MAEASAYAPGRVELLGNHTDYNQGVVLAAAIDRGVKISGRTRDDERIELHSIPFRKRVAAATRVAQPLTRQRWANYVLGVVREFEQRGDQVRGFAAAIDGDVPVGGGLSSSAALEVATAYLLIKLNAVHIAPLELAKLCQRAENDFVGVRSGLLDQATSVFGRAHHLVHIDFRTTSVTTMAFPEELALVIADSGTKHSLIAGEYNTRREECIAAAYALRVPSLRDITLEQLKECEPNIDAVLCRRARHIVGENDRVERAVAAMQNDDAQTIGALMFESHESSRVNFENSTTELDLLVEIARGVPGVLGSRLTGGGFGGGTVTLVAAATAQRAADEINARYAERVGHSANAFVCRIADGAAVLNAP